MSWLRFDDNFLSHPKVRCLSDPQLRVWLRMLCVCSQHDDSTVDRYVIAEVTGLGPALVSKFVDLGLLDESPHGYTVHNWKHYRPKDPTAAERMRNYRRNKNRNDTVTRARDVPDPTREPLASGTSDVDLEAGSSDPPTDFTPDPGDPVARLLLELPDRDAGTESVLRAFNLPEAAYERAREDTRAHGGTTGYAVAILRRIKDENRLATDEEEAVRTNVQPADPIAAIRAMIHNGAITERAVLDAELRAAHLNGATASALIDELEQALT
jgi:hypothetical protein